MKANWEEEHTALIGISTYVVCREGQAWGCYVKRRVPFDCYSSTLVDMRFLVGKAKELADAKRVCVDHAAKAAEEVDHA